MPRNNFQQSDPVITAVLVQVGLIGLGFASLFAIKIGWLAVRMVLLPFHINF